MIAVMLACKARWPKLKTHYRVTIEIRCCQFFSIQIFKKNWQDPTIGINTLWQSRAFFCCFYKSRIFCLALKTFSKMLSFKGFKLKLIRFECRKMTANSCKYPRCRYPDGWKLIKILSHFWVVQSLNGSVAAKTPW